MDSDTLWIFISITTLVVCRTFCENVQISYVVLVRSNELSLNLRTGLLKKLCAYAACANHLRPSLSHFLLVSFLPSNIQPAFGEARWVRGRPRGPTRLPFGAAQIPRKPPHGTGARHTRDASASPVAVFLHPSVYHSILATTGRGRIIIKQRRKKRIARRWGPT